MTLNVMKVIFIVTKKSLTPDLNSLLLSSVTGRGKI